jgi:hypothetical protein
MQLSHTAYFESRETSTTDNSCSLIILWLAGTWKVGVYKIIFGWDHGCTQVLIDFFCFCFVYLVLQARWFIPLSYSTMYQFSDLCTLMPK